MMTTPNTNRSATDTHDSNFDSGSEAYDNEEDVEYPGESSNLYNQTSCISNENKDKESAVRRTSNVPVCHMKLDQLQNLKNSTKRLLCLLEDVQAKTHSTALVLDDPPKMAEVLRPMANWDPDNCDNLMDRSVTDIIGSAAIKRLEKQTEELDSIVIRDKDDDCSVYKRLSRKCHCLNQQEFNDFIIHFNEDTKFCTNTIGEIIKNMFILKKFLYMGGKYTKNALMFLNQGLEEGTHAEKAEIIQACAFADVCCIFDTHTIVTVCISWPCKSPSFMEAEAQEMAAKLLYNLSRLEEGRRYLNFNAKITCDIKKVLKKKQDKINCDTIEMLNSVLNTCQPQIQRNGMNSLTYHCRPMQEAVGNKTLNALTAYREYMTLNELFLHLDILQNLSGNEETKTQLTPHLPAMLSLFKNMLLEFNNSDINVIITNIMANIVGNSVAKNNERECPIAVCETITSCIATEPIKKKNVTIQVPAVPKKKKAHNHRAHSRRPAAVIINNQKKNLEINTQQKCNVIRKPLYPEADNARRQNLITCPIRPKTTPAFNAVDKSKKREASSNNINGNVFRREQTEMSVYTAFINRSRKFMGIGDNRNIIVVPIEEKKNAVE